MTVVLVNLGEYPGLILTLLCVFSDSNFSCGAHRVDSGVSVTGVSALVWRLHVVQDQAAVRGQQDFTTVWTHRDTVSVGREERAEIQFKADELGAPCFTPDGW